MSIEGFYLGREGISINHMVKNKGELGIGTWKHRNLATIFQRGWGCSFRNQNSLLEKSINWHN